MLKVILLIINDIVFINLSFVLAYLIKFKLNFQSFYRITYGNYYNHAQIEPYLQSMYFVTLIWLGCNLISGVYVERKGILADIDEFIKIVKAAVLAIFIVMASQVIVKFFPGSRYVLLYAFLLIVFFFTLTHNIFFLFVYKIFNSDEARNRVLILGTDEFSQAIYERLFHYEKHNYKVIGAMGDKPVKLLYSLEKDYSLLGSYDEVLEKIDEHRVQEVFFTTKTLSREKTSKIVDQLIKRGVRIKMAPSFYDFVATRIENSADLGIPFYIISPSGISKFGSVIKRLFDLFLSLCIFVPSVPIMLIIALLVKFEGKGGVFYKQERLGKNGTPFFMYKFRTMPEGIEEKTGPVIQTKDQEGRATRLGRFLRKTSLDELPQFFNIIQGDMSLVGPRPERPYFVDQFSKQLPNYQLRLNVIPGITGWAQLNGRAALSTRVDEKLMYDLYYINNWSILFDIKILIKTIIYVIKWQGAF